MKREGVMEKGKEGVRERGRKEKGEIRKLVKLKTWTALSNDLRWDLKNGLVQYLTCWDSIWYLDAQTALANFIGLTAGILLLNNDTRVLSLILYCYQNNNWGFIGLRVTELQSDRHPRVPSIRVGENFFMPDFNKLANLLRLQGDKPQNVKNACPFTSIHLSECVFI